MEINAEFFYNRMYLAFIIQHTSTGEELYLPEYNRLQTEFWKASEPQNVIWRKTNANLQS